MLISGAKDKTRIVRHLLDNPGEAPRVRELSRKLDLSPAHVSRTLHELKAAGLINEGALNLSNPLVRSLKVYFNILSVQDIGVYKLLKPLKIKGAGIYGSWANGTNTGDSDLDIWIKVEEHPGESRIATVSGLLRKEAGLKVQILVLTPERISKIRDNDPVFFYSLVFGSIALGGEAVE